MINYSIVPIEQLIPREEASQSTLVPVSHGFCELQKSGDQYTVSRVCSTDLKMYLDPKYAPGAVIRFANSSNSE